MKIFQNKSIFKKLIIVLLVIMLFSFCMPKTVRAEDDGIGGKLLKPIISLILSLGDGVYDIVHKVILQQDITLIHIDFSDSIWETILTVAVFIIVAVVAVVAVVATAGAIVALIPALASIVTVGLGTVLVVGVGTGYVAATLFNAAAFPDDELVLPLYNISPEEIFSNKLVIFDVDFFDPDPDVTYRDKNGDVVYDNNGNPVVLESTAGKLKGVISNWYIILRDISLVALLSVLVYIGIRIIISSTSNDKAKYKQMLIDWIVAFCLLFTMQYIMSFSNILVEKVTDVLTGINYENDSLQILPDKDGKLTRRLQEDYDYTDEQMEALYVKDGEGNYVRNEDGDKQIYWHANLIGLARLNAQMGEKESAAYAGYTLIFLVLVCFTVIFIWTYLKRVIYMAFLTLIAPLVALTYPIDKLNDGKAQAFNMWFKEYIFNLLVQPMHLLLYTILVTSAFELASKNIIYSLVALGFMIPAEKLLRSFFGFEKAKTPGLLAGPAGAALMMSGMNKLLGKGPKGGGKSVSSNSNKTIESSENGKPPRVNKEFDTDEILFGDRDNNNEVLPNGESNNFDDLNESFGIENSENRFNSPYSNDELDEMNDYLSIDTGLRNSNSGTQNNNSNNNDNNNIDDGNSSYNLSRNSNDQNNLQTVTSDTNSSGNQKKKKLKKGHPLRQLGAAAGAATRYYARGTVRNVKEGIANKVRNSNPIKTAAKIGTGVVGATALGTAGLIAGIASGDVTKAAQYTAVGAMGGYKITSGIPDKIDSFTPEGVVDVAERARYDSEDEYKAKKQEAYIKEYQKNEKNMFELEKRYGRKQAKEIMKNDIPKLLDNNVTDMKDISTIIDMKNNGSIKNIDEGIALKKCSSIIGEDTNSMSKKKKDDWKDTFTDRFSKKEAFRGRDHAKMTEDLFKQMDAFNKIRYSK